MEVNPYFQSGLPRPLNGFVDIFSGALDVRIVAIFLEGPICKSHQHLHNETLRKQTYSQPVSARY